ncbi:MAG TPA: hypothetical protein VMA13_01015 [Candidatus Saccharimonadales bacterium]|nr:hypothetical protein [Candidatus Saccharimonadales bacterium]
MKHLTAKVLLLGGAILASSSAFAQNTFVQNDLYLGFQNSTGGGTADYIINLGPVTNIIGSNVVVNLSSAFSSTLFNDPSLQGTSAQIFGGVVGGENYAAGGGTAYIYGTQLRTGNFGNPALPGSSLTQLAKQSQDNSAESALSQLNAPAAGMGLLDSTKSWEAFVEPTPTASSFFGNVGFNPDSAVSTSSILYEDLWETKDSGDARGSQGQPYTYLGYFTLDLTGSSPKFTFTSTNVPASLVPPAISSIIKTGSTVTVVSSNAVPTYNYQLQYTASLSPTNWISVGSSQVATASLVTNTDTSATDSQRFYRIQAH